MSTLVLPPVRLISFGYVHLNGGPPPIADRVEDVRDRVPATGPDLLDLDGLNPLVQEALQGAPGVDALLGNLVDYAGISAGPTRIAIGCAGGRHAASGLAELLAGRLRERGRQVEVVHLHIHLPAVEAVP